MRPAREDVIRLDRDAIYRGAERVALAYARQLKRVPFDRGAEAVREWFQIEASMSGGERVVESASMTPFYDYEELRDVRGNEVEVRVLRQLVLQEQRYSIITDAFTQGARRGKANIWIRVNLGSPDIAQLRDQPEFLLPEFARVFLHEMTHVRDIIKVRDVALPEEDPTKYYNSPHEVRAYMREIVEQVVIQARFNREVRKAPTNAKLVEIALEHSLRWQQVSRYLTPENQERILDAVYRGLERERLLKHGGTANLPRTRTPTRRSKAAEGDHEVLRVGTDRLIVARDSMAAALWDVMDGKTSRTSGPIDVWHEPDVHQRPVDGDLLVDGHHRLVDMLLRGPVHSVDARRVGSGYTDYWATPSTEKRFVFTDARFGGLENLADEKLLQKLSRSRRSKTRANEPARWNCRCR